MCIAHHDGALVVEFMDSANPNECISWLRKGENNEIWLGIQKD